VSECDCVYECGHECVSVRECIECVCVEFVCVSDCVCECVCDCVCFECA